MLGSILFTTAATQICDKNLKKKIDSILQRGEKMDLASSDEDLVLIILSEKKKRRFVVRLHPLLQSRARESFTSLSKNWNRATAVSGHILG